MQIILDRPTFHSAYYRVLCSCDKISENNILSETSGTIISNVSHFGSLDNPIASTTASWKYIRKQWNVALSEAVCAIQKFCQKSRGHSIRPSPHGKPNMFAIYELERFWHIERQKKANILVCYYRNSFLHDALPHYIELTRFTMVREKTRAVPCKALVSYW